jgi:hypothetical protein
MPKKRGIKSMLEFVQGYLNGELSRMDFDLDFNHYLIMYYPEMEHENCDLAECFNFYLAEEGFDRTGGLSDAQHKKLIKKQFSEFVAAMRDGIF